jgi:hypothetical protein
MSAAYRNDPCACTRGAAGQGCSAAEHNARRARHAEHSLVIAASARAGRETAKRPNSGTGTAEIEREGDGI